ncbi:hypothetical protein ACIBQ1_04350 [Nonomuraea sp. NPDC050153]|uniref:hypothetical protein n=1 Tax=Nonomuraea sp. NPDC050153 TaxID=3364359 RepID=UPI0037B5398C
MTQETRLPAWREMRDLVTEGRTAKPAEGVIALDEAERYAPARRARPGPARPRPHHRLLDRRR